MRLDPDLAEAYFELAIIVAQDGDHAAARQHLERVIDLAPSSRQAYYQLGQVLRRLGDVEGAKRNQRLFQEMSAGFEAFRAREKEVLAHPESAEAHYGLAVAQVGLHQELLAQRSYRRAIVLDPEHLRAHVNLGVLHVEAGDLEGARGYLETAVRLDPHSTLARHHLGRLYMNLEEVAFAVAELEAAALLAPESSSVLNDLGTAQLRASLHSEAADTFRRALVVNPAQFQARFNLAVALQRQGDRGGAIRELSALLKRDPGNMRVRERLDQLTQTENGL